MIKDKPIITDRSAFKIDYNNLILSNRIQTTLYRLKTTVVASIRNTFHCIADSRVPYFNYLYLYIINHQTDSCLALKGNETHLTFHPFYYT